MATECLGVNASVCMVVVETGGQGKCLIIGMYVSPIASSLGSGSPPAHENQGTGLRVCVLYTERLITSLHSYTERLITSLRSYTERLITSLRFYTE